MKQVIAIACFCALAGQAQAQKATTDKVFFAASRKEMRGTTVLLQTKGQNITASIAPQAKGALYFYLFDVEGTMVHRAVLEKEKPTRVADLKKGTYTYTVFENDESIDEGKIEIK